MKFLFVHQNFPGQYLHLVRQLARQGKHDIRFLTQREDGHMPGVRKLVYKPGRKVDNHVHHYLRETEAGILCAQQVARVALELKQTGFIPDVMVGHNGWGEIWYLKDVFPDVPLIGYFEFFYSLNGSDVGFDPQESLIFDTGPRLRTKNLGNLLGLDAVDVGQCPTQWQRSRYPVRYRSLLHVVHEGVDTAIVKPDPNAMIKLPTGKSLAVGDEILTYVARNLEPYRGFPSFMRSLPQILAARPEAQVVIVGGDETSYGPGIPNGRTYREQMLLEVGDSLDQSRVHFLGKVPYSTYLKILQISRTHVYLTYPFVLSWSMLEAMAAGCLVIGSRTAPVEEVIRHQDNGLLVDFFNATELAQMVVTALEDPGLFSDVRKRARQSILERYDLARICLPAQIQLLEDAMGRRIIR